MKKLNYIFLIATLAITNCFSQGGFNKNYTLSGSYVSVCTDVIEAPNGNIIMTGLTYDAPTGSNRLTIVGSDAQGSQLWRKNYGSSKFEYLDNFLTSRATIKGNGCFYFYSVVRDSNNKELSVFIKFNFNGDTLWQKKYYDATEYLVINSVVKSIDNGFLMTGEFGDPINPIVRTLLIKTDSTGKELWRKKLSKAIPNGQTGSNIIQDTATKKIIIAGFQSNGTASAYSDFANIIVTDSIGNELQRRTFSNGCGGMFIDLIQTKDKKCLAVGQNDQCNNNSGGTPRTKSYAVKFDLNNLNNVSWIKQFDTLSVYNSFYAINELKNGDVILAGNIDTLKNYGNKEKGMLRLIKLDKDGNLKWKKLYSRDTITVNSKRVRSMNLTQNGSYLVACELYWTPNPRPYSITKIDSLGCDSSVFYCNAVGINENSFINEIVKVFPNPASGVLHVEFLNAAPTGSATEIKIINTLGKVLHTNKLQQLTTQINIKELSNGIYFLQLFDNSKLIGATKIIKE